MTVRVALIGCGRWGTRLLDVLLASRTLDVRVVVESDPEARRCARDRAPRVVSRIEDAIDGVDAAIVATPSATHAHIARQALLAGLDVLVEKPLALNLADALALAACARANHAVAMVGHVLRYHPAVERLIDQARSGKLGSNLRMSSRRVTQSGSRQPLWTLGPHDMSTLLALDSSDLTSVQCGPGDGDGTSIEIELSSGTAASLFVSTGGCVPQRVCRVHGSRGSAFVDELIGRANPLERELEHFARCVHRRDQPRTSFDEGARVVAALELAEQAALRPFPTGLVAAEVHV